MRNIILLSLSLCITGICSAQPSLYDLALHEALLRKGHHTWYIRTLDDSMIIDSTTVIYADGRVKEGNGIIYHMSGGDCVKVKKQLVVCYQWVAKNPEGVKEKKRCVRVWSVLNKPLLLKNGVYAMPDGSVKLPSGERVTMKNNDFMGSDGNLATAFK